MNAPPLLLGFLVSPVVASCEPVVDRVFSGAATTFGAPEGATPDGEFPEATVSIDETVGETTVRVDLGTPSPAATRARVVARGLDAQSTCFHPDFLLPSETVEWAAGTSVVTVPIQVVDDLSAEIDEALVLTLEPLEGGGTPLGALGVIIVDDDRSELIDAEARFGVIPGASTNQTAALQEALDAAASSGRGVVHLTPGEYVVRSVELTPGTSLVGRGAILRRPANTGANLVTVRSLWGGEDDSATTLVQGIVIDGRRDEQGAFSGYEKQNAHLLLLGGDPATPGRLRAHVQGVTFLSGTGDGLAVGPNADVMACDSTAHDVFREGLSVHGGNTRLRVRGFDSTATFGTCGMWLDGDVPGYGGRRRIEAYLEDVMLGTGDLEVAIAEGSQLTLRDFEMGAAPFRLSAPSSTVRIFDSTLRIGIPSDRHNHFAAPDDVEIVRTTLITSESEDEETALAEGDREWAAIRARWTGPAGTDARLTFDACDFRTASDVEATDHVYLADTAGEGGQLVVRESNVAECSCDGFAPVCSGCRVEE